ncbi:pyridoxal-dependent decarboxylase [Paracoccus sp. MBLB3053]|uniref:Pyridoxal-dependent decarboxylase n=1 Tax=Paracoccus aurantius TaxID=3073814 RepID=A0ABU2HW58_9RHOB|nr:pyridoxal-dependent decarboxylase [Paracoccus sp. MBLB3053]MDS9469289.1 pyridoxal-dependent decarboxylase [Paracoccus sp. MBLB3053]
MEERLETLDPEDWQAYAREVHATLDRAIALTASLGHDPVWRPVPAEIRAGFESGVPREPSSLADVLDETWATVLSYPLGNRHPRYWMWYMGASCLTGALGDFLAAVDGSNLGGGNDAAVEVERQVLRWLKEIIGFPPDAGGTLTSGGTVANLIGLTVARNRMAQGNIRENGLSSLKQPLRYYASDQVHACHQKAIELLGLGNRALRRVPTRADCRMQTAALRAAIAEDRAAGYSPACVIATAGTVNTGAIDNLRELAGICREEGLWFHVDGCIGALARLSESHRGLLDGIELADSVALDPHKMMHVPFEAGCVLVRDAAAQLQSFSLGSEYLESMQRGVSAGGWLFDYGIQTSRGFRALKIWLMLKEHGANRFGRIITRNIDQARRIADRIDAEPRLHLLWPVTLDIVCFRFDPGGLETAALTALNIEIMIRLQESGIAAFSDTTVHGEHGLRIAICNHRTTDEDLASALDAVLELGERLCKERSVSEPAK